MAKKRIKRPRDPVELGKLIGDIATPAMAAGVTDTLWEITVTNQMWK